MIDITLQSYLDLVDRHPHFFSNESALFEIITDVSQILAWQEKERAELAKNNKDSGWADIGILVNDPYVLVIRDLVKFSNGKLGGYIRVVNTADLDNGVAVAVIPIVDNKVVLLYQYRHATRSWHYEVPRGFGVEHLSAEDNAIKEIEEEIDGRVEELVDLGNYQSNTGMERTNVKLFMAKLSAFGSPDLSEGIEKIHLVDVERLEQMIVEGEITDGFSIASYTRAKLMGVLPV